jgi:hypothetical protein
LAILSAALLLTIPALPQEISQQQHIRPEPNPLNLKSESQAFWLSFLGTALPLGLLLAITPPLGHSQIQAWEVWAGTAASVMVIAPSLGYLYGAVPFRGLQGIGIRTALLCGVFISGLESTLSSCFWAAFLGSIVWDISAVSGHVRKHNLKLQGTSLALAPILYPVKTGVGVGLQIQFSF